MRTSIKFLVFAGAFGLVVGVVYWFQAYESAGTALLLLMGAAPLIMGGYLVLHGRRATEAEDDPGGRPEDQAGMDLGTFSTGSVWPLIMGVGVIIGVIGAIFGLWMVIGGLAIFAAATIGLMQESAG